ALSEARGLVAAAGCEVVGDGIVQRVLRPDASTLLGSGKVLEIRGEVDRLAPDLVVIDNDLTPAQIRNLEKRLGKRVVDRSELILDIFATRARTRQARLQVELAQVEYLMPRLRRMWTHLERTEGAIGTRGPGETQLETDKRLIKRRIHDLRMQLAEIEARKQREVRTRAEEFTIGLVGYTNAGKSTLLNALTDSDELAADMLFATLDTRTRRWRLRDGRRVLLSDTVGFLQRLPHHLVASFHATLEEALSVDLLLHVVDGSHADAAVQMGAVDSVLADLVGPHRDVVLVLNKLDRVGDPLALQHLVAGRPEPVVLVSARTREGLAALDALVSDRLDRRSALVELAIPFTQGRLLPELRRLGTVLSETYDAERGALVRLRIPDRELGNLLRGAGAAVSVTVVEAAREPYAGQADSSGEQGEEPAPLRC
ncbi:MAG TPA: GTPase HflX, partial [Planctomycetota bacterium]|nr:GTPase HflX [Planctomycetota bacterium]